MQWTQILGGGEVIGSIVLVLSLTGAIYLLWREVTRRRRIEAELSQFAVTLDATPNAIIGAKLDGTIFSWNPAAERIYGYPGHEAIGRNLAMLVPDNPGDAMTQIFDVVGRGQRVDHHETTRLRKDGDTIHISLSAAPIRDSRERIMGLVLVSQDIRAQKQAESERDRLFNLSADLMCVAGTDGFFKRVNPAFTRVLGYTEQELLSQPFAGWIHPADRDATAAQIKHMAQSSATANFRNRFECKNGTYKWLSWTAVPVVEEGLIYAAARDVTQAQHDEVKLKQSATHDELTNLPNRALIHKRLEMAIQHTRNGDYQFAVLFLDFDHFKVINDSLGHDVGDRLLCAIAGRLRNNLRENDTTAALFDDMPARMGGDEFVVLLDDITAPSAAEHVADRLLEKLAAPYKLAGHEVTSTASIGIVYCDGQYDNAADILRDADLAMYEAKHQGRSKYVVYDGGMHRKALRRLHLERDLRRATEDQTFHLHYQPIIALSSARVVGFEALLRWPHPQLGPVLPLEFISLAEELGLIVPIGEWVLEEACKQLARWQERFDPDLSVNVNLSKRQLFDAKLVDQVDTIIGQTGIAPESLKLEVTESVIVDCRDQITDVLSRIRERGVRFCMDDFGTGLSSLSCLHQFPFDVLKIDRAFIRNMDDHRQYTAVVQAIVTLAQTLGMSVVAEGIENASQLAQLQALDCDLAQGYFFAHPMPAADTEAYLANPIKLAKSA